MPPLEWDPRTAMVVVMAAKGYPGSYPKDTPINKVITLNINPKPYPEDIPP